MNKYLEDFLAEAATAQEEMGTITDVYIGVLPFMAVMALVIVLLIIWPDIAYGYQIKSKAHGRPYRGLILINYYGSGSSTKLGLITPQGD